MLLEYNIYQNDMPVGCAKLEKCGMYYRIQCKCNIYDTQMYRIKICINTGEIPLGICVVAEDKTIGLTSRVLCSQLEGKSMRFVLESKGEGSELIPVSATKPLSCMTEIMHARFCRVDQKPYIELLK